MTRIGGFLFPTKATHVQSMMVEANSKVRKELRIRSLLRAASPRELDKRLQELQAAVEAFDCGKATLSLRPGEIHYGRRRSFELAPQRRSLAAGVDLLIWTNDRYARSETLHQLEGETYLSNAQASVFNRGNWSSPAQISIEAKSLIQTVTIETASETFTLTDVVNSGETLVVDSDNRAVGINGRNAFAASNQQFPMLEPGANTLQITLTPSSAEAQFQVAYRDVWV
ncbi:MAG: phage tail family protein [Candidatus Hinthialibacter antarcticus]|nr:phage tail family protein [Candidatus Hinthialibacter antarcticus]